MPSSSSDQYDAAPALTRGIALLSQLSTDGAASLEHLARSTGWPKSSVSRLLKSLESAGLIVRDPVTRHYAAVCRLIRTDAAENGLRTFGGRALVRLAMETRQTAELYAFDETHPALPLTMIDRCEPEDSEVHVRARIGFQRDVLELEAVSQITIAFGGLKYSPENAWIWRGKMREQLNREETSTVIEKVVQTRLGVDVEANANGVYRYAVGIFSAAQSLIGVLAIAQFCKLNDLAPPHPALMEAIRVVGEELQGTLLSHG